VTDRAKHQPAARAAGKQSFRRSFDVSGADAGTLVIPALADEAAEPVRPVAPVVPEGPVDTPSSNGRIVLAASLGAGGLALCIASPLWASHVKHDYDDGVAKGEMPSYSSARLQQHVATGMFVVGLGLIGAGAYVYLTRPSPGAGQGTAIAPVVGRDLVGVAISGAL
jgi:hypothetical protein